MASDAPDWQWVINATVVPPITDGPDWEFVGVAPGGGPLTGYASLTGPGQTTTPGDLTQAGGLFINTQEGSSFDFLVETNGPNGIVLNDVAEVGIELVVGQSQINMGQGAPQDTTIFARGILISGNRGGVQGVEIDFPIGFGQPGVGRSTVTGAKGGNAALGSLLTALASYGLIIDSTTP